MATAASLEAEQNTSSRWLKAAQAGWIVLAIFSLTALAASMPSAHVLFVSYDQFDPEQLYLFLIVMAVVVSLGLAALLFWQRRDDKMALYLAYFFLLYGIIMLGPLELIADFIGSDQVVNLGNAILTVPVVILFYIFPTGAFVPSWSRWLVPVAFLIGPAMEATELFSASIGPNSLSFLSNLGGFLFILMLIVGFYGQFVRYRRISSIRERLQVKWVLYGFGLFFLIMIISVLPYAYLQSLPPDTPQPWWAGPFGALYFIGLMVVPISFSVSILRYRLWDIDFIIRRTMVYGLLTALIVLIYFGSIVVLQSLFTAVSGQQSAIAIVISTLIIAALFQPLRQRIQRWIDRRFFRAKYDAAKTLASFATTARDEVDLEKLSLSLMQAVNETMQPEQAWLWLKNYERPVDGL